MTTREIVKTFKELYGADISPSLISKVTDSVMVGNSVRYVPWKDYKAVTADLKTIYQASTEESALQALEDFSDKWDNKYPQISRS